MKTTVRGSKSPAKSESSKQSTMPTSPENGHHGTSVPLSYLGYRPDHGRYTVGRGSNTNFLQKNRQAISRNYGTTSHINPSGNYPASTGGGSSPPRSKIGQAPCIGDALGTPSNKGSSSFMSAGHNGVRDAALKGGFKKRDNY